MQLELGFNGGTARYCALGSGSSGNSLVLESEGRNLLVDAGFSCRELERRLGTVGAAPQGCAAVLLTHEHQDHVRGAVRFSRRHQVPIYATEGTLQGLRLSPHAPTPQLLAAGRQVEIGPFQVEPFAVPHDAREPVGFVIETSDGLRLGLAADVGESLPRIWQQLEDLDALVLEANHDLEMLMRGPYPWHLKQRIAGDRGHLSNADAAGGLERVLCDRLSSIMLYHLSRVNNRPMLAEDAIAGRLTKLGADLHLQVSDQFQPSEWIPLG